MGLSPDTLWNMTLREWRAALAGLAERRGVRAQSSAHAMARAELAQLMQLYPDTKP